MHKRYKKIQRYLHIINSFINDEISLFSFLLLCSISSILSIHSPFFLFYREVGAKNKYAQKVQKDPAISAYNKVYQTKIMRTRRNPDNKELKEQFENFKLRGTVHFYLQYPLITYSISPICLYLPYI